MLSKQEILLVLITLNTIYVVSSFEEYLNLSEDEQEIADMNQQRSNPYRIPGTNTFQSSVFSSLRWHHFPPCQVLIGAVLVPLLNIMINWEDSVPLISVVGLTMCVIVWNVANKSMVWQTILWSQSYIVGVIKSFGSVYRRLEVSWQTPLVGFTFRYRTSATRKPIR